MQGVINEIDSISDRENKKQIISEIIAIVVTVLDPKDALLNDEQYPKLRKEYLTFLNKFPWFESLTPNVQEIFHM